MGKISAVVFDMDGVLIEAKEWHYEALNKALALFGYEISRHDHLTTYNGLPTRKKLEMLSLEQGLPQGLHQFINDMKQIYTVQIATSNCSPQFIHEYALSRLKAEGFLLGVASNSIRETVDLMLNKAHLTEWLDVMLSNEDVDKPKPAPDIYLKAMENLGVSPANCLVVEDNHHGIAAAQAAGSHILAVKEVSEVNYQNIITRIREIEASQ